MRDMIWFEYDEPHWNSYNGGCDAYFDWGFRVPDAEVAQEFIDEGHADDIEGFEDLDLAEQMVIIDKWVLDHWDYLW